MNETRTPDRDEFARLITHWRLNRGLSQEALGAMINLSQRHISFIENGRSRPSLAALLRVIQALMVSAADGNRLLNLLGYRASLSANDADWQAAAPRLDFFSSAVTRGLDPLPATAISDHCRVRRMSPVQAMWWNRVAHYPEVFSDDLLSYPRAVFHPEGLRRSTENWEEFALAYLQTILRERALDSESSEKIIDEIRTVTSTPNSWLKIRDDVPKLDDIVLRQKTALGVVKLNFTTFSINQSSGYNAATCPEITINYLTPTDKKSSAKLTALRRKAKPECMHERLRAAYF